MGVYHSKIDHVNRKNILEQYDNGSLRILVSCKALDEGLNIPATDVGIVVSSTASNRHRTQRLGRILRKTQSEQKASLYYLYVGDSSEESEMLPNIDPAFFIPTIHMGYSIPYESFFCDKYETCAERAMQCLFGKNVSVDILDEVYRNIAIGTVRFDWLMSEAWCMD